MVLQIIGGQPLATKQVRLPTELLIRHSTARVRTI
jgi:DNA-binding LacI/PurR family transcriptional regulator